MARIRKRSKGETREEILAAARSLLGSDWPDSMSVSKIAIAAGVNRGTAYQHFETRDDLIKATVDSVGSLLSTTIFGNIELDGAGRWRGNSKRPVHDVVSSLVNFAVKNPAICRIWLFEVLSSGHPSKDQFFRQFKESTRELAETEFAQEGIDVEALSVLMLAGYFLWPVWVDAHAKTKIQRQVMADRMSKEVVRLLLFGVLKPEAFPEIKDFIDTVSAE